MDTRTDAEREMDLVTAQMLVAEDFAYLVAALFALSVHLAWENWWLTIPSALVANYASLYKYNKRFKKAEAAWQAEVRGE